MVYFVIIIERMKDERKKLKVRELYEIAEISISYSEEIRRRSQEIMEQSRIRSFDSLHIAAAEAAGADVMLTTDDKLEKMASGSELKVQVMNPLKCVWEVF